MTNFIQRAITGILFICVIAAALVLSPLSYAILMTCVITLATHEFCRMVRITGARPQFHMAVLINVVVFTIGFLICHSSLDMRLLLLVVCLVWFVFLRELFNNTSEKPIYNIALTLLCIVYIGVPFGLFNLLAFKNGVYDFRPIACLFVMGWINDTGAYLCGVTMGKHKLFERISPHKTIEGFVGGVVLTLIASYFLSMISGYELWFCVACALIVSVIGTCGDLIESMFKRSVNMKDSGTLLPGHGGILDRFDSIIYSTPLVSLLYYFFL